MINPDYEMSDSEQREMADLRRLYLERAENELDRFDALVADDSGRSALAGEPRQIVHRLKGTGGSYGYPRVTELAGRLEQACVEGEPRDVVAAMSSELRAELHRLARHNDDGYSSA